MTKFIYTTNGINLRTLNYGAKALNILTIIIPRPKGRGK